MVALRKMETEKKERWKREKSHWVPSTRGWKPTLVLVALTWLRDDQPNFSLNSSQMFTNNLSLTYPQKTASPVTSTGVWLEKEGNATWGGGRWCQLNSDQGYWKLLPEHRVGRNFYWASSVCCIIPVCFTTLWHLNPYVTCVGLASPSSWLKKGKTHRYFSSWLKKGKTHIYFSAAILCISRPGLRMRARPTYQVI